MVPLMRSMVKVNAVTPVSPSACVYAGRGRRDTNLLGITLRQGRVDGQARAGKGVARRIALIGRQHEGRSGRRIRRADELGHFGALPSPAAGGLYPTNDALAGSVMS